MLANFRVPMKLHIFFFLMVMLAGAIQAQADPLTFSNVSVLQNNGFTSVNLISNPNVTVFGPELTFTVDISGVLPPGGSDTLRVTYLDGSGASIVQTFAIPLLGSVQPPVTLFFTINVPAINFNAMPATLTLDLLSSNPDFIVPNTGAGVDSFTFAFNVAEPVPEPATLTLLGGGLTVLVVRYRRRLIGKKAAARTAQQPD